MFFSHEIKTKCKLCNNNLRFSIPNSNENDVVIIFLQLILNTEKNLNNIQAYHI